MSRGRSKMREAAGTLMSQGPRAMRRDAAALDMLAAIERHEGRGPEAARQALDGYRTRRVMPVGVGEVIRLRSHRQIAAAKRTGTDG